MPEALTFVEIDIPICSLTYGVAPCTASIPATGSAKCFNSLATCQDTANYAPSTVTLRFAVATAFLPRDIDIVGPLIASVEYSPAIVSLGENLGQRASLKVTFFDQPHSDAGAGFDKYNQERGYDPYGQGTLWGRFRARQPFLRGAALRWITGFVGDDLADMETRYFFIESFDGLTTDGKFSVTAKDVLKFLDPDRAQAPALSNGFLVSAIDVDDGEATLSPSGIGDDEYDTTGYVNVGGNEVAYYSRDPYTKLLLHFDGTDGAVSTSDTDVANPHAVTFHGSAQLDTAQFKFGTASLQLGTSGNYVSLADSDDWFLGTGDFTIDIHCRFATVPSGAPDGNFNNVLFSQQQDSNNRMHFGFDGTSVVFVHIDASTTRAQYSATHGMSNATWHHWRIVRSGTSFFIFRDGTSLTLTVGTAISTNSLANLAAELTLSFATNAGADHVDEFRWRKGIADTTSNFTAPTAAYTLTGTGDVIRLTRAQKGTTASSHAAQDRVQKCLIFDAQDPADIIADLIENFTDTPVGYVQRATWLVETAANLNRLYTACITEPTAVNKLVSEVVQQGPLALWDDNVAQQIRLQVLRGIPTDAALYDESNVMRGTFTVADQPDKRVTQVWIYYGQIDPTKRVDDPDNYRSVAKAIDATAEANFGAPAILKIFARWVPQFGGSVASSLGAKVLSRYTTAPRKLGFDVFRDDVTLAPELGAGYRFEWWNLQEADGSRSNLPIQVTRLLPGPASIKVDAEEMLFTASADDLTNRQIVIDFNTNNFNLKTVHDTLYPALEAGQTLTCTIAAGVTVGSSSVSTPAFHVGDWAGTPDITIVNNGRIQGKGGQGGQGGRNTSNDGHDGVDGGVALFTREAITLTDTDGEAWGGGGGGGGGAWKTDGASAGGGGGGGAGKDIGLGGVSGLGGASGADGTTEAGGAGGAGVGFFPGGIGGDGGGPGLAGSAGEDEPLSNSFGGAGGSPGLAIDGISFVTTSGAAGDRRGGTAN
jgi:hypothetical protein